MSTVTIRAPRSEKQRERASAAVYAVEAALEKTETDPVKRICIYRVVRAIEDELPGEVLERIGRGATDIVALYRCLAQPEFAAELRQEDPLADARLRGREIADELLSMEGGYLTLSQAARYLNMSRQGVERRRQRNRLVAIARGRKGFAYPKWQFSADGKAGVLPGLEEVLAALAAQGVRGWGVLSFFLNPHADLDGRTPLEALRQGLTQDALSAASAEGEMGR